MSYTICGYTICGAKDGGFYITENVSNDQYRKIIFAGSLDECLAYVKTKLGGPAVQGGSDA